MTKKIRYKICFPELFDEKEFENFGKRIERWAFKHIGKNTMHCVCVNVCVCVCVCIGSY